jgi:Bacterial lipid A biosynthesis acyltransferase
MSRLVGQGPREPWCVSLPGTSLATLRSVASALEVEQLKPYGYDYCYLNLLTLFGHCFTNEQLSSLATECMRNHLLGGEEFHAYCLAARGQRFWDSEIQMLDAAIQLTPHAKLLLKELLANGSIIACGFHWGAYRFIPFALGSLGIPVKLMLGEQGVDKYGAYFQFDEGILDEMRARGVPESFYRVSTVGTHREADLFKELKSLKHSPAALFIPVDGMFTAENSRTTVEVSFAGFPLRVKANPARLAAALRAPLVSLFARRQNSGDIAVDVAEVIQPNSSKPSLQTAMQQLYRSLEERAMERPEQWEGARTFHHLRKRASIAAPVEPTAQDILAVRSGLECGQLSFDQSRVACVQIGGGGGGRIWIDGRTLRCFSGTPKVLKTLNALDNPDDMARLWQEVRSDAEDSDSLIQLLAQLQAAGVMKHSGEHRSSAAHDFSYGCLARQER